MCSVLSEPKSLSTEHSGLENVHRVYVHSRRLQCAICTLLYAIRHKKHSVRSKSSPNVRIWTALHVLQTSMYSLDSIIRISSSFAIRLLALLCAFQLVRHIKENLKTPNSCLPEVELPISFNRCVCGVDLII
jgi:hypothetical protein